MRIVPLAAFLLAYSVSACATTPGSEDGPPRDRYLISFEELQTLPSLSAHQAIQRLRPAWLQSRGPVSGGAATSSFPSVYLDGVSMGGLNILRDLRVEQIQELRFIHARDATTQQDLFEKEGSLFIDVHR